MEKLEIIKKHIENGVIILDVDHTYIDELVQIGKGTTIYPNVSLRGNCVIGLNNTIDMNSVIVDTKIGDHNQIISSYIVGSEIGDHNEIGPFANIKANTYIGNENKIGNFVEIKSSEIKSKNRIKHLSYIGDLKIENQINIGAGVIIANYNSKTKQKQQSQIADDASIGANVTLISPVKIGKNSQVAAGSVITEEVPENTLAIARNRQINKENYYKGESV